VWLVQDDADSITPVIDGNAALPKVCAGMKPECNGSDWTILDVYGLNASRLDDRESITRLVKNNGLIRNKPAPTGVEPYCADNATDQPVLLSPACRVCVLATVASVGGEGFIEDDLHIVPESGMKQIAPLLCIPALAQRLISEQMVRLGLALTSDGPFALVSSPSPPQPGSGVADLFLHETGDGFLGQRVFVGLDTGYRIYSCNPADHPQVWAVTSSTDREQWKRCQGLLWLDLRNAQARARLASDDGAAVPLVAYEDLSQCATVLRMPPPILADTLRSRNSARGRGVLADALLRSADSGKWRTNSAPDRVALERATASALDRRPGRAHGSIRSDHRRREHAYRRPEAAAGADRRDARLAANHHR
jgi:hypothetical protein